MEILEQRHLLSAAPLLNTIDDVTMGAGTAYYVNLEASDPDVLPDGSGEKLTYDVSVSSSQLETMIPSDEDNQSLRINIDSPGNSINGSMEFQLFEEISPLATDRIITLANDGFYDGIIFHRVIDDFMIQGGDPTGYGSGGSELGEFDAEFGPWGMHSSGGVLSMANSGDDTNDSQFFITEVPTRWLDFHHTVFGTLTAGEDIREAISEVSTDGSFRPDYEVTMTSVEVFRDYEDGVLMLKAPEGFTGNVEVTVTVDDGNGGTAQRAFTVTVEAEANNAPEPVDDAFTIQEDATLEISADDLTGNDYDADGDVLTVTSVTNPTYGTVQFSDGVIVFTPPFDFSGDVTFEYAVFDGEAEALGIVTITMVAVNDAPIAATDFFITNQETPLDIDATDLLMNDCDVDTGDRLSVTGVANYTHGTVVLHDDTITFTPDPGFTGDATFRYTISDGNGGESTGTVVVTVEPSEQPQLPGDLNDDGRVGYADLDIVRSHWGETVPIGSLLHGDASSDGRIGYADLDIVRSNWGDVICATAGAPLGAEDTPASSTPSAIGPRRASASEAAMALWRNSNTDCGISEADLAAIAKAAWLREIEGLQSKETRKHVDATTPCSRVEIS